jgi:FtsP/CotA-like multicopper oxidase with cupredoxin domain
LLTAYVHAVLAPSHLRAVPWLGVGFAAFAVAAGSLALVLLVRPGERCTQLAGVLCLGAVALYALSRTAGLPGHDHDIGNWFDANGVLAVVTESYVAVVALGPSARARLWRPAFVLAACGFAIGVAPAAGALPLHPHSGPAQHGELGGHGGHGVHDHAAGDPTVGLPLAAAAESRTEPSGGRCGRRAVVRRYDVVALAVDITLNRWGDHDPRGRAYVLTSDVERVRAEEAANAAARKAAAPPAVSLGLQGDAIQPMTLRVRPGECLRLSLRNEVPGEAVSLHLHAAALRIRGTDRPAVPGESLALAQTGARVEYEWAVPKDAAEGTHYFHSAGTDDESGRQQTSHGLYGAVIVEPKNSRWLDPLSGRETTTGWSSVIETPGRAAFREFALYYAEIGDETYQPLNRRGEPLPQAESLSGAYRVGARAINYRSEPFYDRLLRQRELTGRVDDSVSYSSYSFGDPATPVMWSYLGDPVTQRIIHAGSETAHVHHVHGGSVRWRRQPGEGPTGATGGLDKHPALLPGPSERTDSQTIGPSETFDVQDECGAGGCQQSAGDFLFHCHVAHHYFAGMWGLWRVYNTLQDGPHSTDELPPLRPLEGRDAPAAAVDSTQLVGTVVNGVALTAADVPTWLAAVLPPPGVPRGYDASVWDWRLQGDRAMGEPDDRMSWPDHTATTPGQRHPVLFDPRTGRPAYPMLRPHFGRRPPFAPGHGPAPYLDPTSGPDLPAPGADGPASICPAGTTLRQLPVKAIEVPVPLNARQGLVDPEGKLFVLQQQEAAVRADRDLRRPLTVRANAGQDCLDVTLTNGLSDTTDPHGFSKVSLHVHFVQFDVQGSDGVDGGFNYEQTVRPFVGGSQLSAPAAAGTTRIQLRGAVTPGTLIGIGLDRPDGFEIAQVSAVQGATAVLRAPLRSEHRAGEAVSPEFVRYRWYPDVQFGTTFFHDHVNAILGQPHGLYGALVVEPPGASYTDPRTGEPLAAGALADVHTNRPTSVDVKGSFRELVTYLADDEPLASVGRDTGGDLNLRVEPLAGRPDPTTPFAERAASPETATVQAYVGDPVVFRTLVGASNEVHSFHVDGHGFRVEPWSRGSPLVSTVPLGISERFDVALRAAGGPGRQPGDYLFGNGRLGKLEGGSWGVLRVRAGPSADDLKPLTGRSPATSPPEVCPARAPVVTAAVTAAVRPLAMLGGQPGLVFARADRPADVRPLVLRIVSGQCLEVRLTNHTERRLSLHADLLVQPAADAATGTNNVHAVDPGGTDVYRMYAAPELGSVVAQLRDGVNPVESTRKGLYGAVVVLPAGATHRDAADGVSSVVRTRDGRAYRDFTVFLQDGDQSIGTHRMPYTKSVDGIAAISYGSSVKGSRLQPPLLEAYAGDPLRLHVIAAGSEQAQVFSLDGHSWPVEPGTRGTAHVGATTVAGMQALDVRPDGGAGGVEHLIGDYRYGDARLPYDVAGMTGILRVHPLTEKVAAVSVLPSPTSHRRILAMALAAVAGLLLLVAVVAMQVRRRRRAAGRPVIGPSASPG